MEKKTGQLKLRWILVFCFFALGLHSPGAAVEWSGCWSCAFPSFFSFLLLLQPSLLDFLRVRLYSAWGLVVSFLPLLFLQLRRRVQRWNSHPARRTQVPASHVTGSSATILSKRAMLELSPGSPDTGSSAAVFVKRATLEPRPVVLEPWFQHNRLLVPAPQSL